MNTCKHDISFEQHCHNCEIDFLTATKTDTFQNADAIHKIVTGTAEKVEKLIYNEVKAAELTPTQMFLVIGRIIQYVFNNHFKIGVDVSDNVIHKKLENFRKTKNIKPI